MAIVLLVVLLLALVLLIVLLLAVEGRCLKIFTVFKSVHLIPMSPTAATSGGGRWCR